jgi:hypothetical protein
MNHSIHSFTLQSSRPMRRSVLLSTATMIASTSPLTAFA